MRSYYLNQSNGNLKVSGDVYGWFTAKNPAAYYGGETETDHDARPRDLVYEAVEQLVAAGVDLSEYDLEDPYDLDGDGNIYEPDMIVDHLMVLHAGMGQEEGGGSMGPDAIWSHSWSLKGPQKVPGANRYVYSYTTEPENGAVGVMVHEFAHDLGIPDDYDTVYSSYGDIVEYWSLMASGSWAGKVGGTRPVGINPWGRIMLGLTHGGEWTNWAYLPLQNANGVNTNLTTNSYNPGSALQSVVVGLPDQVIKVVTPTEGSKVFWGGQETMMDNWFSFPLDLKSVAAPKLTYDINYNTEEEWDAAFVQISEDGGQTWTSLVTPSMKSWTNPDAREEVIAAMPGYTGKSAGWLNESIDLTSYVGKDVLVRMRYITDPYVSESGVFFDNIKVSDGTNVLFANGGENAFEGLDNHDFQVNNGTKTAPHFYVAEWRSHKNVDVGLTELARAQFDYNRGMLLWYKNDLYDNNWVGDHPGYGQLGVVDAQQYVNQEQGMSSLKNNNNAQSKNANAGKAVYLSSWINLKDAAFSLDPTPETDLSMYSWSTTGMLPSQPAVPTFNDANAYFNSKNPDGGLKLPSYGLRISVTGRSSDYSQGQINFSVK